MSSDLYDCGYTLNNRDNVSYDDYDGDEDDEDGNSNSFKGNILMVTGKCNNHPNE